MIDLEKLGEELQRDTQIDQLNLQEKQLMLPAIKHKWVARLIQHKRKLNQLYRQKKTTKLGMQAALEGKTPPGVPKALLDRRIEASEVCQNIDEEIQDTELVIEYLEKVEQIMRSMTYDIGNIIKIISLETT